MKNNTRDILIALASGVIAGAATTALLSAENRNTIRGHLTGVNGKIEDEVDKILLEGKKSWLSVKSEISDAGIDAESYFNHLVTEGRKALKEARHKAESIKEDVKSNSGTNGAVSKVVEEGKRLWNSISSRAEDTYDDVKTIAQNKVTNAKNKIEKHVDELESSIS